MKLNDKTALVTGANRGIGLAIVNELLTRGIKKIYAAARNPGDLPDFGDDRVVPIRVDITNPADIKAAAAQAGDVNLLINNAGTAAFANLLDAPLETIQGDMNVNYYGTLRMVRAFAPVLEANEESAIVNVATIAAFVNFPGLGGYSASKAALFSLSQGIRIELAPRGISVHTVNPGPIDTDMAKDLDMEKTSPEDTAKSIVDALVAGDADIFPDAGAQQMIGIWKQDYRQLEQVVYDLHHAA